MQPSSTIRIAILDMYNGIPNQGMRCVHEILEEFQTEHQLPMETTVYDVRVKNELPALEAFDICISSGGPGSPVETIDTDWDKKWCALMDSIFEHNRVTNDASKKKYVFFICHSYQMACRHFGLGKVVKRHSTAFGVFPTHKLDAGSTDPIFSGLSEPFYTVEHRDYQVIQPSLERFEQMGAEVLAIEKDRPHVDFERATVAIRFSKEAVGTQFHPEADGIGMRVHLAKPEQRASIVEKYGEEKYNETLDRLDDPDKIILTQSVIIPNFLLDSVEALMGVEC